MERNEKRIIIRQAVNILIFAAVAGFAVNLVHPRGYEFVSRKTMHQKKSVNISSAEAYIKFSHSAAVFVDTRDEDIYREGHIQKAIHVPSFPESLSIEKISLMKQTLFSDKELILYCDSGCDSSKKIALRLYALGYDRHIYILKDGIGDWTEKGYPVE